MSISDNCMLFWSKRFKGNALRKLQNAFNLHFSLPIGVFWDLETCRVPIDKSAFALVQNIRENFFENHREVEFVCVCDVLKHSRKVIEELIFAQVTVVHVNEIKKNEAYGKIKQYMKRFVDKQNGLPSTMLLISENVNFSSDLPDFRHFHKTRIILVHRGRAHRSLLACADEHYNFFAIASAVSSKISSKISGTRLNLLLVTNLPMNLNAGKIICILRKLSGICGGRVFKIRGEYKVVIHFPTLDAAVTAQKQMNKRCIYGKEMSVTFYCGTGFDISASPFKRNKIQISTSNESDRSKWPSYSTQMVKETFKTSIPDLSCSKFDLPRIISLVYNGTDEPVSSEISEADKKCSMIKNLVSKGFEAPFVHSLHHLKSSSMNKSHKFEIPSIYGLHYAKNSLFDSKPVEKKMINANHALKIATYAGERYLKAKNLQNSLNKSFSQSIPTSEIAPDCPQKSRLLHDENEDFNVEEKMPVLSEKGIPKNCFSLDSAIFERKQGTKSEKSRSALLEVSHVQLVHHHSNYTERNDRDKVQVDCTENTFKIERKRSHRIAARFTIPIE